MSVTNLDEYRRQREVDAEIAKLKDDTYRLSEWWAYIKHGLCDKPEPPEAA